MRLPAGVSEPGRDPTRLFPNLRYESIFLIERLQGSTLHIACDDASMDSSPQMTVASRAAAVVGKLLRTAFTLHESGSSEQRVIDLRAQLIQAEKLASFGQVVAGVVHELANPLTSIVAYAEYLTKKARSQSQANEDVQRLERIGEAAQRILRFSRDLIAYARPSADSPGPVPIHDVIDQAISFCEHEFTRRDIALVRRFGVGLPAVRGLGPQLTQVFVNLFTNAAHAMDAHGGKLFVDTEFEEAKDVVTVRITDTGVGIPPELMERLFDPFFTTKEKGKGTGLGLYIVSDIVKAHGGTLGAASTPGEGTTFTLRLPLYYRDPQSIRRTIPGR
jgi:signal transduction histidine kinase